MEKIDFGSLRRLVPVSRQWGFDRGTPVDRYYIESFLGAHSDVIQGRVLEIKDRYYTEQFGSSRVISSDVLDIDPDNTEATIIADITRRDGLSPDCYDCIIFTQTLQLIPEPEAALRNLHYILQPGGHLLLTSPGITKIQTTGPESQWYWSFTSLSLEMLLAKKFDQDKVSVVSYGNVFTATCFLWGIALEEIEREELDYKDQNYPLVLTVCATK